MRVADEGRVRVGKAAIQPQAKLVAKVGAGRDAAQMRELRRQQRRRYDPSLLVALIVAEEEDTVTPDGAAEAKAKLPPLKERVRIGGIAVERGIGGQRMIAEKVEARAMQFVAARTRDHVDCCAVGGFRSEVEIHSRSLELLDDFLRKAYRRAAVSHCHDTAAIYCDARAATAVAHGLTQSRDKYSVAAGARRRLDARFEFGQFEKAAPVQGQALDLALCDHTADGVGIIMNLRRGALHGDRVVRSTDYQNEVRIRGNARFHCRMSNHALEPLNIRAYLILASLERGETVITVLGGDHRARQAGRQACQLDLRFRDGSSRWIADYAGDGAGR